MLRNLWQDLRYGIRMLRKSPGFTIVAVLALGLGIGSTTAIFSVVYATLFEPMPFANPDQLVIVWSRVNGGRNVVSAADYLEWKRRSKSFQYLGASSGGSFNLSSTERPEQINGGYNTPGLQGMFGNPMFMGRDFLPEEGEPGKDHVVIVSNRIWRQQFAADPNIIGRDIRLNGEQYKVAGVLPPGQRDRHPSQILAPLAFKPEQINHDFHWLLVIGRLKPDVSVAQAQAEMEMIARQIAEENPKSNSNWSASVEPLQNNFLPDTTRRNLWLLLGAVGFVLLIACANVANLLLARGTGRQKEIAIRASMGATRSRLFLQFLTENVVLALIGGILGVSLAAAIIKIILVLMPPFMLPSEADVRLSIPVLLFSMASTIITGLLFGCAPAWQAADLNLSQVMKEGARSGAGRSRRMLRKALVIVEFALALTMLAGGGMALRSFWNLTRVDLGVRVERALAFNLPVPQSRFSAAQEVTAYYRRLLEKIKAVPGVEIATVSMGLPLRGPAFGMPFTIVGQPVVDPSARPGAGFQMITPEYFETFGMRVVKGRGFGELDREGSVRVAMINETFVNRYFSGVDPLAQRIMVEELIPGKTQLGPPLEWQIVGVFNNVRGGNLREDYPVIFVPFWQSPWPQAMVGVRTAGDPASLTRSITAAVNEVDPDLPLAGITTMEQMVSESLSIDRFGMLLYGSFAALALLLAAVGIYGVMAFAVSQRIHEIGVRMALGAGRAQVFALILREGAILALFGVVVGLAGAYLVGRAMQATLYGVGAIDPIVFSAVSFVLLLAALLACIFPARHASKVDPIVALRQE
jgi:putative ABC transport system permease protein